MRPRAEKECARAQTSPAFWCACAGDSGAFEALCMRQKLQREVELVALCSIAAACASRRALKSLRCQKIPPLFFVPAGLNKHHIEQLKALNQCLYRFWRRGPDREATERRRRRQTQLDLSLSLPSHLDRSG